MAIGNVRSLLRCFKFWLIRFETFVRLRMKNKGWNVHFEMFTIKVRVPAKFSLKNSVSENHSDFRQ